MVRGATDQEGRGAKEGTEASILDPPSVPVSCFTARPFNLVSTTRAHFLETDSL